MAEQDDVAASKILKEARPWLNSEVVNWKLVRWKYSEPIQWQDEACRTLHENPPMVLAGDAFVAPRIEGAALSGWAGADTVHDLLS